MKPCIIAIQIWVQYTLACPLYSVLVLQCSPVAQLAYLRPPVKCTMEGTKSLSEEGVEMGMLQYASTHSTVMVCVC